MFRVFRLMAVVAAFAGGGLLGLPSVARADFELTIAEAGGPSVTVHDNGTGDLDSTVGSIVFAGSVGDFTIQISVGTSNASAGVLPAELTINNTSISALGFTGTKTLTITLQDTGFTVPAQGEQANLVSQVSTTQLPTGSTVTYASALNGVYGTQLQLSSVGGTANSESVITPSNPYTLTSVTTYTVQGQGLGTPISVQTTGLTAITAPAPSGLLLAGAGIPCIGFGAWLRRRTKA